ncbi:hypothetical protein [Gloeocapsopsis sp. IPPAS B-1203]|uniref:hypothetical protein n=1 Tax=Gloeocapsopsis sp. IPPAS B-1203 TaxID=2049454 RepID=UPI0025A17C43|nr:hypothetical protein [Gloeocapsopsis sp. IPPAS B-1203]
MAKVNMSFSIDLPIYQLIEEQAAKTKRPKSTLVNEALAKGFSRQLKAREKRLEATTNE